MFHLPARRQMRREIDIMRYLYHRNVVILFEVLEGDTGDTKNPDDEGLVCMIEEYMEGGATMTYDEDSGVFKRKLDGGVGPGLAYSEDEAKPLFRDLCQGLLYLHDQGIIHRDVKVSRSSSVLVHPQDFGCIPCGGLLGHAEKSWMSCVPSCWWHVGEVGLSGFVFLRLLAVDPAAVGQ